jgi:D-xylose transport system ATP-binding protein
LTAFVESRQITKDFPGVRALDGIDFRVVPGEILGLIGENGAGKTTLMRILSGVYPFGTYGGDILIDGKVARFSTPLDAEHAGIAIIHQELSNFQDLTVAENMFVGHLPKKGALVSWSTMQKQAAEWLKQVDADCTPRSRMGDLSIGTQQLIEIAKALSRQSRVLILDEPTSALSSRECEALFKLLARLKNQGKGLVYISHKMDEIFKLCDRLTVLRDGKSVYETLTKDTNQNTLISHMVGRSVTQQFPPRPQAKGASDLIASKQNSNVLSVKNLNVLNGHGRQVLKDVSFELRAGEILGFAGLLGSGRSELLHTLCGDPSLKPNGEIKILGELKTGNSPRDGLFHHVALVPEDRKKQSIFPKRSLTENVSQSRLALKNMFSRINFREQKTLVDESLKRFRVKTTNSERGIETLSGGNQQKIILGRALQAKPKIILLDEPTRGVDIGAKYEIYEILFSLIQNGHALIVVSGELPELLGICDRIGVLTEGRLTSIFERDAFDPHEIMRFAVGSA